VRIEHRLAKYNFDANEKFDLIIIGGGINGAGIARDAAQRGLKVLLLEKDDFGSGCSAHSTRLIHGGLRYLEHLEFNLVKESLDEREILLKNYPHLVNPIALMIPAYKHNKNGLLKLNLGMFLYDILSSKKSLPSYQRIEKDQLDKLNLKINPKDFEGAVYYYDAQITNAERLVLENIKSAEEYGAVCLNHCEASEIIIENNQAIGVRFKDNLNTKRPFVAYAKNIVNLAGPWVDLVNERLRDKNGLLVEPQLKRKIGGTKGSHIVVKSFTGAPQGFGLYNEAKSDSRPFFILPFKIANNDTLYLIGTTDLYLEEKDNLDKLEITDKEINYLLNETNELFPEAKLSKSNIVNTFIGVRPLPYIDKNKKEGGVTRKHFIVDHSKEGINNYYSVVGGKLTTFRSLAKEVVNLFSSNKCFTSEKLTSSADFKEEFNSYIKNKIKEYSERYDIEASIILHLILIYGTKASEVLDLTKANPLLKNRISKDFEDIEAQIVYAIRNESAFTIDDIVKRRLSLGLCLDKYDRDLIKTIKYHLDEEFELIGRNRDKVLEEQLVGDYNY
jgi:glycerol-3-phosphate dehydrogenase